MTKSNPSISFNNHGTLYIFKVSHNIFNIVKREGGNIKYLSLIIVTQSMVFYLSIWLYVTSEAANYKNKINKYTKLDPTLPRINTVNCPNVDCASNKMIEGEKKETHREQDKEIIYIRYDDKNMKYVYLCAVCDTVWDS